MTVIPIIIGALGTVLKSLKRRLDKLEIGGRIETIQIMVIVEIGKNIKKSLRNMRRLPSLRLHQLTLV